MRTAATRCIQSTRSGTWSRRPGHWVPRMGRGQRGRGARRLGHRAARPAGRPAAGLGRGVARAGLRGRNPLGRAGLWRAPRATRCSGVSRCRRCESSRSLDCTCSWRRWASVPGRPLSPGWPSAAPGYCWQAPHAVALLAGSRLFPPRHPAVLLAGCAGAGVSSAALAAPEVAALLITGLTEQGPKATLLEMLVGR
jgi:hypothetical protein